MTVVVTAAVRSVYAMLSKSAASAWSCPAWRMIL